MSTKTCPFRYGVKVNVLQRHWSIHFVEGTMNNVQYNNVVKKLVVPTARNHFPYHLEFISTLASCHTAKKVRKSHYLMSAKLIEYNIVLLV
ncbi:hypothetical protein NPIL_474951 [Nephila pilipes]|uniref:Uncharacterized protein n=1 Tax=Nephila pilipes TaxID=299642 RepID=A0A8X6N092_NEPPI|nr:hypothetical protein NPIL_474951 [Nephila pilipes]